MIRFRLLPDFLACGAVEGDDSVLGLGSALPESSATDESGGRLKLAESDATGGTVSLTGALSTGVPDSTGDAVTTASAVCVELGAGAGLTGEDLLGLGAAVVLGAGAGAGVLVAGAGVFDGDGALDGVDALVDDGAGAGAVAVGVEDGVGVTLGAGGLLAGGEDDGTGVGSGAGLVLAGGGVGAGEELGAGADDVAFA